MTFIAPAPNGWRVDLCTSPNPISGNGGDRCKDCSEGCGGTHVPTFADAVATLPAPSAARIRRIPSPKVRVALPARLAIFERLTLPSVDRTELSDMVRLQLEKILPYPLEEATFGFQTVSQREKPAALPGEPLKEPETKFTLESTIVVCVVHNSSVDTLCAPLLDRMIFPEHLTIWAMHVASQAQQAGEVCGIWQEESGVVFAIYENGILSFAEIIESPDNVLEELPQVLMGAELAGAATTFSAVLVDPALAHLSEKAGEYLGAPVKELRVGEVPCSIPAEDPVDLRLETWHTQLARRERMYKVRKQVAVAVLAYSAALLFVLALLGVMSHRLRLVETELASTMPEVNAIHNQQARWNSMASAIDARRFTLEVLFQTVQSLPSSDVRFTKFEARPTFFSLQGEAPEAEQAIELGEKLKGRPDLKDFYFDTPTPARLPNNHWQFTFTGKL